MKVIAYTALHYGRDYLAYAIQSIIEHVDEYHVLYTAIGSHGHRTPIPCPETRAELYAIASTVAGSKLRWHDGEWAHEGLQRDSIHEYVPDADAIIVCDADEIYPDYDFRHYCEAFADIAGRRVRLPFVHFWRSFYRAIIHDPAFPERIIFPKSKNPNIGVFYPPKGAEFRYSNDPHFSVAHMGYAQRPEIVEYKILTHGHRNEWRHDVDWFKDKYLANAQTDTHPVGSEYWNPETVDPWLYMPAFMKSHPYAKLQVIE